MKAQRHHTCSVSFSLSFFLVFIISLCAASLAFAAGNGVKLDSSLGQKPGIVSGGTVNGKPTTYLINDTLGKKTGSNLFYSFDTFNIYTGESATFHSPSNSSYSNIISRVTGGSMSTIDGLLRSTIDGANLYLLNPSGVLFGPNASLDVKGSFHVSTADYLKFSNGDVFYADPAKSSVLSVASPEAFGFLTSNPAAISVDRSILTVPDGQTLSIVGGDITAQNDTTASTYFDYDNYLPGSTYYTLSAPGGKINLVSVASTGEVNLGNPDVGSFTKLGNITFSSGANINVSSSDGTTPAGAVVVRGGQLLFSDGSIDAVGSTGGTIDVKADSVEFNYANLSVGGSDSAGSIAIQGGLISFNGCNVDASGNPGGIISVKGGSFLVDSTYLLAETYGDTDHPGTAFDINLSGDFRMTNASLIGSTSSASGKAGDMTINANDITLGDDTPGTGRYADYGFYGAITSTSVGAGRGGDISISADSLVVQNGCYISSSTYGSANAGNVTVRADSIKILDQGSISSNGVSEVGGNGGTVDITARDILISATNEAAVINSQTTTGIAAQAEFSSNGGTIRVCADNLQLVDGGKIDTLLRGTGRGANVEVTAKNIQISGFVLDTNMLPDPYTFAGIDARVFDAGATGTGGNITVTTNNLNISNGGVIRTNLYNNAPGKAGNIAVNGGVINIASGGQIYADSFRGTGDSGDLNITANSMSITGFGSSQPPYPVPDFTGLSTTTNAGRGGTINVTLSGDLSITAQGGIKADTQGIGLGGAITINAKNVVLNDNSTINSSSSGAGNAGDIKITASDSVLLNNSSITTEAMQADGGNIKIYAPYMVNLDNSKITASVGGGPQTTGGNITIDPQYVILKNSQIVANAYEGTGGNIQIVADVFLADPQSRVDASSALGISGTVDIEADITNVSGLLAPLSTEFVSAAALLRERCIARLRGGKYSSFIVGGRDSLPIEPGNLLPGILQ